MQQPKSQHLLTVSPSRHNWKEKTMKLKKMIVSGALAVSAVTMTMPASAQDVLTGDTRLACEALLCLASGTRPTECAPSISKYFSISYRRFTDTLKGRLNFLKLCPVSSQSPEMQSFVNAIAYGAGRCDAESLNAQMMVQGAEGTTIYISSQLPDYCMAYIGNQYSNLGGTTPKYVGTPERGGYWVAASDYDAALAAYMARIEAEEAARYNSFSGG